LSFVRNYVPILIVKQIVKIINPKRSLMERNKKLPFILRNQNFSPFF